MANKLKNKHREALLGLTFAAIPLVGFTVFYFIPFGITLWKTVVGADGKRFIGISNYINVLGSSAFQLAAWNTVMFITAGVLSLLALSLGVALLLKKELKCTDAFRTAYVLPIVLPTASVIMVFRILFDNGGVVNFTLSKLNMPPINLLYSENTFWVLLFLFIWKNIGYGIILMLGGLLQIPQDYYESARVDGAGFFRQLYKITMPLMTPTIMFTALFGIMFGFKAFREAYALAGDYPFKNIYMMQHFMNNNFTNLNYGRLSVAAVITFLVIAVLVCLVFRRQFSDGSDNG